ncbi:MAG: DUF6311 domain-containing protein [Patescibacteria group bacterium]|nr:DUF6311 domain-containing protein [Patescibacteria group bacterium]
MAPFLADSDSSWLMTNRLSYPLFLSVSMFDPMPLFLLFAKAFTWFLPDGYQFIGYYFVLCLTLQGLLGYATVLRVMDFVNNRKEISDHIIAFLVALMIVTVPFTLNRFSGHIALSSQWILMASIWATLVTINETKKSRWLLLNGVVLIFSTGINVYLSLMVLINCLIFYGSKRQIWGFKNTILGAFVLCALWIASWLIFGFAVGAEVSVGTWDYQHNSMNLLGPIDSNGKAGLLPIDIPDPTGRQSGEGYNYLGVGIIILIIMAAIMTMQIKKIKQFEEMRAIVLPAVLVIFISFMMAVTNTIYLSKYKLFTLPLPRGIEVHLAKSDHLEGSFGLLVFG